MATKNTGNMTWTIEVQEEGDELVLPLPQELLDHLGWQIGDMLDWQPGDNSTWTLRKKFYQERAAQGQKGMLIRGIDNVYYFRQYDPEGDFVDYELTHHDLEIEIQDASAALIRNERGDYLDYTSQSMQVQK